MGSETLYTDIPLLLDFQYRIFERLLASSVLPLMCKEKLKLSYRTFVTVHPSNTLDNQCGATITDSSVSCASLPLLIWQRKEKQLEVVYLLVKVKLY